MHGGPDERTDRRTVLINKQIDRQANEQTHRRTDRQIDGWMLGRKFNGWIDGWTNRSLDLFVHPLACWYFWYTSMISRIFRKKQNVICMLTILRYFYPRKTSIWSLKDKIKIFVNASDWTSPNKFSLNATKTDWMIIAPYNKLNQITSQLSIAWGDFTI